MWLGLTVTSVAFRGGRRFLVFGLLFGSLSVWLACGLCPLTAVFGGCVLAATGTGWAAGGVGGARCGVCFAECPLPLTAVFGCRLRC